MKILVVGGAGYVGSHVALVLQEAGFEAVVFDNLSTGHLWAVQFGSLIQGDIEDIEALRQAMVEVEPQAVIHLASLINVRDSIRNPQVFYENISATLNLLKVMVETGVKQIVFSSSAAVYGEPQYLPIDERHPKAPMNPYAKTKFAIEGMLEDFANAYGIRYVALRYFNACGADPQLRVGEAHTPETHLIPLAIRVAMGQQPILQVYGNHYDTPDGMAVRDYVHVLDLAYAHVKALKYLCAQSQSIQVNLGTGRGYSVQEIVQAVSHFACSPIPTTVLPQFSMDSPALVADASLAKNILDWSPQYSSLETIIATAWNWHQKYSTISTAL
ncbi:MAG: UDP-glucose 4-epimerase GalE [Chlamydiae bacterium RIFCSPHIGHO2_12_FULL_44_59]|nr:MAG: UDP-glucose 4-epimerase GalE [Chlamydiae bacterium RIFCSPHIGHO2_01_FULL_44_39]OGN59068.1 MAG: UDP-glucose 4-epimerase GalE [Chlamydiae bacterium RIFCSPHIGHO2_02_FULL_45_9]OGN60266.1 MAG: UDP-glucose 4-epimerase GalE [Chlamydiae bacterium RIFCSPHIGHO2_12_FULL_44_59]OGN67081.1 MAG: UDP-glucose 4-epimerase GalE [Chlamydiae bacterium RIFCSPLOWO2_01_FULL_44_52]OGN67671.1 MAG: UDP-glucose 4-epimerase GalE [Chlamydiae bacterium RIFCSPLOWO2_02_FULL_45_22]OGN71374.1 MAG: UDP-glucose 4-epimerase